LQGLSDDAIRRGNEKFLLYFIFIAWPLLCALSVVELVHCWEQFSYGWIFIKGFGGLLDAHERFFGMA